MRYLCLLLLLAAGAALAQPAPVALSPDGLRLIAASGKPLVLRGANWGWWNCVEPGDARLMRAQGATTVRIAFWWTKITKPGTDELGGEGLALLDAMCRWAEEAGLWFVLDCHEPPGGCGPAAYVFGGKNLLWRDANYQAQFVRMWGELARRYRHHEHLLAYELMNEPVPPEGYTAAEYRELCLRAIHALRAEDPGRLVVVSGWSWGGVAGLKDEIVLPRPRLLYSFHMYSPGAVTHQGASYPGTTRLGSRWLGNSPERWGAQGDSDWQLLEKAFTVPAGATHGTVMLRSDSNAGTAWFDDVTLTCNGKAVSLGANTTFEAGARDKGWKVERQTAGEFTWDGSEGKGAAGSLRIFGTDSYNAWTGGGFTAAPGAECVLRCRVKTKGATGFTYPAIAWFADTEEPVNRAWLEAQIRPAVRFSRRHHVPLYCGEFGCSQSNPDGTGLRWPRDVGEILNGLGIPWTYWNWRETTGRGSMGVWVKEGGRYVSQEPLAHLLGELWRGDSR